MDKNRFARKRCQELYFSSSKVLDELIERSIGIRLANEYLDAKSKIVSFQWWLQREGFRG